MPFRTLVNNFCMLILPFVEVCAHVLCEHVYALTANSPALWLKIKRKIKTKTQTLIRLLNYEEERDAWPSWQLWGLSISMYVGAILYSLLPTPFLLYFIWQSSQSFRESWFIFRVFLMCRGGF